MSIEIIKSILIFLAMCFFLFFIADKIKREPTQSVTTQEQSTLFLELVDRIEEIDIDVNNIQTQSSNTLKTEVPTTQAPTNFGRPNPFSSAAGSNSSLPRAQRLVIRKNSPTATTQSDDADPVAGPIGDLDGGSGDGPAEGPIVDDGDGN